MKPKTKKILVVVSAVLVTALLVLAAFIASREERGPADDNPPVATEIPLPTKEPTPEPTLSAAPDDEKLPDPPDLDHIGHDGFDEYIPPEERWDEVVTQEPPETPHDESDEFAEDVDAIWKPRTEAFIQAWFSNRDNHDAWLAGIDPYVTREMYELMTIAIIEDDGYAYNGVVLESLPERSDFLEKTVRGILWDHPNLLMRIDITEDGQWRVAEVHEER